MDCFKAVGTFFGDPEACKKELTAHLRKKLAPLDVIDTIVDTDCVTNTSQLRLNLVQRIACAKTKYIAGITPPNVACDALEFAHNRIRKSFESIARADASPQALRDLAWLQAQLPTEMGGCNIDTAFSRADSDFSMSLLKNWRTLVAHNPDFALDEGGASKYPAIAAAIATYESALSDWKEVCEKRTARDKNKYYTVRGGYLTEFYPKSVPLPEPESLPATDAILNGTCKSTYPRPRALAAIKNHKDWFAHQELVKARDVHVKNNPSLGDSAVNNREAARFVSASTPFAGKAFDVRVDGTYATALSSDTLQDELQRKLGLWLSAALPTLRVALERGMPVDFFGDYLYNKAHHRRPHDGVLAAWADAMRAPANAPVVHGDKEKPELTRQYNEGYKVDLAEPHAGPGGCDEVNEVKLWTPLLKTSSPGVGNASSGGTPASVGHSYAFGNTEEKARRLNMGCKARGQPGPPFDHTLSIFSLITYLIINTYLITRVANNKLIIRLLTALMQAAILLLSSSSTEPPALRDVRRVGRLGGPQTTPSRGWGEIWRAVMWLAPPAPRPLKRAGVPWGGAAPTRLSRQMGAELMGRAPDLGLSPCASSPRMSLSPRSPRFSLLRGCPRAARHRCRAGDTRHHPRGTHWGR